VFYLETVTLLLLFLCKIIFKMISKNTQKLIKSLSVKKYRIKEGLFLVEGDKMVLEVLQSNFVVNKLIGTSAFLSANENKLSKASEIIEATQEEIKSTSLLKNPQNCMAVCKIRATHDFPKKMNGDLTLYLDGIQDPGNLGTIIRLSDWFGIEDIFCSSDTADVFNPKVVQASMGSIFRTNVWYTSLEELVKEEGFSEIPVLGAFLNGQNIFSEKLPKQAILVVGNEGSGIRPSTESFVGKKIMIPGFTKSEGKTESLNVSVATGIICAEFRRQLYF